ncbi:3-oxoacyl-ACP synthase III family protein [Terasakiella pusilla]|uniref:3-oxoacyl-ACP synthase III family protein n=1 Tax=Terasakiella pusilla TaxID=64973 RepID=UPI003AA84A6D
MRSDINNVQISGVIGVVPSEIAYFDDEISNYSHDQSSSEKLKATMGYDQHRVVKKTITISGLVKHAVENIDCDSFDISKIGAIIVVTQTPDKQIPATSSIIHGLCGLPHSCYCIDINDGCAGYIKGLFESSSLFRNSDIDEILLVCGDILSPRISIHDRNSFPLVGDAVTISWIKKQHSTQVQPLELLFDGCGAEALQIPAGGTALPYSGSSDVLEKDEDGNRRSPSNLVMKGRDVFTFTQTVVLKFIASFVNEHNLHNASRFFLHQANLFILNRIRKKLKIKSEALPTTVIEKYGNSSSATIPMSIILDYKEGDFRHISETIVLAGFGVGLSWGAASITMTGLEFCQLIEMDI